MRSLEHLAEGLGGVAFLVARHLFGSAGNHDAALTVVRDAAAAGDRDLDLASLRYIDPAGIHALLTGIRGGLRLRRPNQMVRRLAALLANHQWPGTDDHIDD